MGLLYFFTFVEAIAVIAFAFTGVVSYQLVFWPFLITSLGLGGLHNKLGILGGA